MARNKFVDAYGDGCARGHDLAGNWLTNKDRGNARIGGTLQHIVLELAKRYAAANGEIEKSAISGEIVGFCYAIECPESAAACQMIMTINRAKDKPSSEPMH